tara:strand:- start:283 stop:1281 length:999 start_codon:yes stop_codon:yes gene_type:complete
MALSTTYNVAGDREDLTDYLTILTPEDTPKVSTFAKTQRMSNAYQEWQMDTLNAVNFSGVPEGQDVLAFSNESVNRARVGNYVQQFRRSWMVSRLQEASNPAGISSEVAQSKIKAMREIKRDIEAAIGSDNDRQQESPPAPYLFRALGKWISTSPGTDVPAAFYTPTASIDTTATASLGESAFNDVFQSIFQQNGGRRSYTLFAGPNLKRAISKFQRQEGTTTLKTYVVTQGAAEHQIDLDVTVYVGDFHTVTIVPDLFNGVLNNASPSAATNQQKARGYVIDPELVGIGYMLPIESNEIPDLGGGRRGFILAALTLMVKNPLGLGKFAASS